eukprot:scaffold1112_cov195-Alexandrium_tamarense.AAC.19
MTVRLSSYTEDSRQHKDPPRRQSTSTNNTNNMTATSRIRVVTTTCLLLLACTGGVTSFTATSPVATVSRKNTRSSFRPTTCLAAGPLEVIDPSYNLALGSVALGAAFGLPGSPLKSKLSAFLGGIPLTLFGLFIAFQTTNLRFTFDDSNFSLVSSNLKSIGENVVVGGENSWAYKSFVNYDFFPSRSFPILVYFKGNVGPGEQANSPEALEKGAVPGQVHFFPAIANTADLAKAFEKHDCAKLE